jgi:hypothetical protein
MKRYLSTLVAASVVALSACSDALDPGNATEDDRAEIVAILDESGWFADEFGEDGAVPDFSLGLGTGFDFGLALVAEAQAEVPLVRLWGRRHREPVSRERRINVNDTEGVADVVWIVTFRGLFMLDRSADDVVNPTSKPMLHQAVQHARFVRRETADENGRRWRMVGVSAREWRMTDPEKRTVDVTRVEVSVNGESQLVIENPLAILDLDTRLPRLQVGDTVRVTARVENTTGHDNTPQQFVFLHLFHANTDRRGWIRVQMRLTDAGQYVRQWIVRHAGRERIVVDAIDSQTFNTDSEDDYRANLIGIPYRVGESDGVTGG